MEIKDNIRTIKDFFQKDFFYKKSTLFALWLILPIIAALTKFNSHNNFVIFRYVFHHVIDKLPLYEAYPEYYDYNHYGPFFSLLISPFAVAPLWISLLFWLVALSMSLFFAIKMLKLDYRKETFIYYFVAHELLTALFMSQFNIAVVAMIVASFACINRGKDFWAAFFIMLGFFVKLYTIVGLAFFFFSKNKIKFISSLVFWSIIFFIAPMLISSPEYIIEQYYAWAERLSLKNGDNMFALSQNVSLLGMVRKISGNPNYSDILLIMPALLIFSIPYLRFSQYKYLGFRYAMLSSVLLFTVLFSTGSESSTYIIAFVGVAIWYLNSPSKRNKWDLALLIFAFILTSMSPSDLFPKYIRINYVLPYALKALPCAIIWFKQIWEMLSFDYQKSRIENKSFDVR